MVFYNGVALYGDGKDDIAGGRITATIAKGSAPELTEDQLPTVKEDTVFNGEDVELVNPPKELPDGYTTLVYTLGEDDENVPDDDEDWSSEIPVSNIEGTYYIWVKAIDNDNYNDTDAVCIVVTYEPKDKAKVIFDEDKETNVEEVAADGLADLVTEEDDSNTIIVMEVEPSTEEELVEALGQETVDEINAAVEDSFTVGEGETVEKEYLDVTITKYVDGEAVEKITEAGKVLEVVFKYDLTGKYAPILIREHEGVVQALKRLLTRPAEGEYTDGTYWVGDNEFHVYASRFSTYTIAYLTNPAWTVSINTGSGEQQIVVREGDKLERPADPTLEGRTFLGWFNGNEEYDFDEAITKDLVLTAKFDTKEEEKETEKEPETDPEKEPETDPGKESESSDEQSSEPEVPAVKVVKIYRLFESRTNEHFFTANVDEYKFQIGNLYTDEGIAWSVPEKSATPVYRVFDANRTGDHYYTTSKEEAQAFVAKGWVDEGIAFYSDDSKIRPVYMLVNSKLSTGIYHYTASAEERDALIAAGWEDKGIAFYAK